jgi:branched-chain amino acid aminotransferase
MSFVFFQDKLLTVDKFSFDISDRGLLLGDGLFETMRSDNGQVIFLKHHWERLCHGLSVLEIPFSFSFEEVKSAVKMVLEANNLHKQSASLRLTVTRGKGPRGLVPQRASSGIFFLAAFPFIPSQKTFYTAKISSIRRNEYSPLSRIKSLCYLDNILAKREAIKAERDEALLLNTKGKLVEASTANVFFLKEGCLYTADPLEGALPGVLRKIVLEMAREISMPVVFRTFFPKEIASLDEAFLTNSLLGIMPLVQIDDQEIGNGRKGKLTLQFQNILKVLRNRHLECGAFI